MNKIILVIALLTNINVAQAAGECSDSLKSVLLSEAKALFNHSSTSTQMFRSTDDETPRVRKLFFPMGSATNSFYEYYKREGDPGLMVFHIERTNGNYRAMFTDLGLTEVLFCNTDTQNVDVDWISSLPRINVEITCNSNFEVAAEGFLQYFDNRVEIGGGLWKNRTTGVPTMCNGKAKLGSTIYTSIERNQTSALLD